jgi:hypothetical protein
MDKKGEKGKRLKGKGRPGREVLTQAVLEM